MQVHLKSVAALALLGLTGWNASAQMPSCPLRPAPGTVVADPLNLSSQNGVLSLDLTMQNGTDSAGYGHYCYNYASASYTVESPTLRLSPGDILQLSLTNKLNATLPNVPKSLLRIPSMKDMDMSARAINGKPMTATADNAHSSTPRPCLDGPVTMNTTNLHFHGLNIPPTCHQDDVITTMIQPGMPAFLYEFQIPLNEPPGLYWYHSHPHGYTTLQVNGGATGAIIINGIENVKPQVAGLTERVFLLREQFLNPLAWVPGTAQLTLNYQPALAPTAPSPIVQMKPGEKQFWRVANTTTQAFLDLQVLFGTTPQSLELIAIDGVPVNGDPNVTDIQLPPAGRAEFVVTGPQEGQAATFVTAGMDTGPIGNPNKPQTFANIVATNAANGAPTAVVPKSNARPRATPRFEGLPAVTPTATRALYFAEAPLGTNPPVNFFIAVEGQQPTLFSMNQPPNIVTRVGSVEDWTVENRTGETHAFHIHQIHFLVTAIDGIPIPPANQNLQDTVILPSWSGTGPYHRVTVRMDFRDPTIAGEFVYHCHVLFHEDGGMMGTILVKPLNPAGCRANSGPDCDPNRYPDTTPAPGDQSAVHQ